MYVYKVMFCIVFYVLYCLLYFILFLSVIFLKLLTSYFKYNVSGLVHQNLHRLCEKPMKYIRKKKKLRASNINQLSKC